MLPDDAIPAPMLAQFRANGKLLLSGEYAVLEGALALGLPTLRGQSLTLFANAENDFLLWESLEPSGNCWFSAAFSLPDLQLLYHRGNPQTAATLTDILLKVRRQNPHFLTQAQPLKAVTHLEFPPNWGLGSSSTLITCIAQWAEVNPYQLLQDTMGGSGYDIACAISDTPVLYRKTTQHISVEKIDFEPAFAEHLYFVYLGKKQNSRLAINHFYQHYHQHTNLINLISALTLEIANAKTLPQFETLLNQHEQLLAQALQLKTARQNYFPDYQLGCIKSLGAWGGDFVLATSHQSAHTTARYFTGKGYHTIIPYAQMVKPLVQG
ncbi:MAG TPA: GYDIA family GHMP kinase [Chitinophagales bacterium]|nr:GYDIA family GHMP kinase [Chitinophagales bacterium]HRK27564.1 GYDIA family GHMP kinase [Chitinophagales bacterium]